jgi:hypothetical protein
MGRERCAATGCGRFTARGATHCARHAPAQPIAGERAPPVDEEPNARGAFFRERLATGDYRALLGPGIWSAVAGGFGVLVERGVLVARGVCVGLGVLVAVGSGVSGSGLAIGEPSRPSA